MSEHVLLTGATGLVGQYLVRDLLLRGVPLAVVIRSQEGTPAAQRLDAILQHWEGELGQPLPRPVCLAGEITQPDLGLSPDDLRWVAEHCRSILHNAASLKFQGNDRTEEPWLSNYTGTSNVLDLCRRAGVREMHYVSTAYVCGRRQGCIRETELDCGQEFRNDYEQCKFEAEKLVTSADFLDRRTVYRPAVIVGDSRTGFTITYHALYSYFQFIELFCQTQPLNADGNRVLDVRLNLTGNEPRNLIPVDWVSAVIAHLFLSPEHHGRTYHLTPPRPVTAQELMEGMTSRFNVVGVRCVGPDAMTESNKNAVERLFYDYVAQYQPYWTEDPLFDCTNTLLAAPHLPCPQIDRDCIHRLIDFAIADNWGKRRRKRRARSAD
jgi:thioester reductase-like protein